MRVKRLEIFDTFLKGFDDSGEKYASNFNSTPINKHEWINYIVKSKCIKY